MWLNEEQPGSECPAVCSMLSTKTSMVRDTEQAYEIIRHTAFILWELSARIRLKQLQHYTNIESIRFREKKRQSR